MKELWNSLKDISFDESDKNLFQVDDPRLRADAIRFSILPRIHNIFNASISVICKVYGTDVYEDSIASYFPHFRTKRDNELEHMYDTAYVGLGGKRSKKPKGTSINKFPRKCSLKKRHRQARINFPYHGDLCNLNKTYLIS